MAAVAAVAAAAAVVAVVTAAVDGMPPQNTKGVCFGDVIRNNIAAKFQLCRIPLALWSVDMHI